MQVQKSPGGSIFPYHYKGGTLHALKYGSFYADDAALLEIMKAEENFIMKPNRRLPIWVDFYKTNLSPKVLNAFIENISHLNKHKHITKLAIVGCSLLAKWRLRRLLKKSGISALLTIQYFSDPEDAKTWLVGE
jgi:hypothetical protein